jgi:hypothetical protein
MSPTSPLDPHQQLVPKGRSAGKTRAWILTAATATGLVLGAAGIAGAASTQTSTSTSATSSSAATAPAANSAAAPHDPAKLTNGPGETLLTGTTADQVKAVALAAVPGSTIIRVETDSAGSPYEAHMTKSDGTQVTVKLDSSFAVSSTENGFGPGPAHGQAPADNSSTSSTTAGN